MPFLSVFSKDKGQYYFIPSCVINIITHVENSRKMPMSFRELISVTSNPLDNKGPGGMVWVLLRGRLAQRIEHKPPELGVAGSIPASPSN
jgi:hypothetical protein